MSFFEPDCSWCYRQMKTLNRLHEDCPHRVQPLLVGINGNRRQLQKELRKAKVRYPAFSANRDLLRTTGKIPATPLTLIVDRQGQFLSAIRGYVPEVKLRAVLKQHGLGQCKPI